MTAKTAPSSPWWAYFDTSALVKRYVDEAGRPQVMQLLRRHHCVSSAVLPVELRSALRRRVSEGTLDPARIAETFKRITADRVYWTLIDVGTEVLEAAETLVAAHSLRTLDAIHVASTQLFAARVGTLDVVFVSADKRQTEAATAVGLTVRLIVS